MSMLGRAFAGFGAGVSSLASRYIDEELQANRLKLHTELQHQAAVRMDQYNLSPERQAALQSAEGGMIKARLGATNAATVENELANAGNANLQDTRKRLKDDESAADIERERKRIEGLTPAQVTAERERAKARADVELQALKDRLPLEVQRAYAMADAQGKASAKYRERPPSIQDKMADTEKALGRALTEPEKLALIGLAKQGKDPELDVVTIERTAEDGKGGTVKTTEKRTRRPGAAGGGADEEAAAMQQARDAIAKGADPAKVNARLAELGYKPLQAAAPAKAATAAPAPSARPVPPEEARISQAQQAVRAAMAKLQAYGSTQRQRDPEGFAAAQREMAAAEEALRAAQGAYADQGSMIPRMLPTP
jgi:hypothetical protein